MVEKPLTWKALSGATGRNQSEDTPPASHFLVSALPGFHHLPIIYLKFESVSGSVWLEQSPHGLVFSETQILLEVSLVVSYSCQSRPVKIQGSPSRYGQNPQSIREKRISQRHKVTTSLLRTSQALDYRLPGGRLLALLRSYWKDIMLCNIPSKWCKLVNQKPYQVMKWMNKQCELPFLAPIFIRTFPLWFKNKTF